MLSESFRESSGGRINSLARTMSETPIDLASGSTKRSPSPTAHATEAPAKQPRTDAPLVEMASVESAHNSEAAPVTDESIEQPTGEAEEPAAATPRQRKQGVKPEELPTLSQRYADPGDDFEPFDGPTAYRHEPLLNDKIVLW